MENFFKRIFLPFNQFFPVVKAEEAEEEVSDPQIILRSQCQTKECEKLFNKLETCNERVRSKKKTSETCDEEMIDFVECLDHCVAKTLFTQLK